MASSSPWEEMQEHDFICPICLDNLKTPKLLPCFHRYCRLCLAPIVEGNREEFDCSICKTACTIPENGVNGFITDLHVQNMLEFITLQKSVISEEPQTCKGCKKKEPVIAYCFRCEGFLCDQWYQFHLNSDIFQDHGNHVLVLADIIDNKLSLQKLASLKTAPRCHVHIEKQAEVCCETCDNLPICMVCGHYGEHEGHQISDVKETAMKERAKIRKVVSEVDQYRACAYNLPGRSEEARKRLRSLSDEKRKLQLQYQENIEQIRELMKTTDKLLAESKAKIEEEEIEELAELQKMRSSELEAAAKKINEKFDELENEVKEKRRSHCEEQEQMFGEKRANLEEKLGLLNTRGERAADELAESESRIRRFDSFMSTVSSILAAEDDWTDSQCLPYVISASLLLVEEVKKQERGTISAIYTREIPSIINMVKVAEIPEYVEKIDGIKHNYGWVVATAADACGHVVLSGKASNTHAFITAVDANGSLLWHKSLESTDTAIRNPICYSSALSKQLLVNACNFNTVSIRHFLDGSLVSTFDVCDEATESSHGSDIINDWKRNKVISSVTSDPANKDIYIGSHNRRRRISREMMVFNGRLKYKHTIVLPNDICWARGITFHRGHLLVCDYEGKAGYLVSVDNRRTRIVHRFTYPTFGDGDWRPFVVCTDINEFIYIMWDAEVDSRWKCVVTQYSPDSHHQLLMMKPVDDHARGLTTTFVDGREKLLVATSNTREMYLYDLVTSSI